MVCVNVIVGNNTEFLLYSWVFLQLKDSISEFYFIFFKKYFIQFCFSFLIFLLKDILLQEKKPMYGITSVVKNQELNRSWMQGKTKCCSEEKI